MNSFKRRKGKRNISLGRILFQNMGKTHPRINGWIVNQLDFNWKIKERKKFDKGNGWESVLWTLGMAWRGLQVTNFHWCLPSICTGIAASVPCLRWCFISLILEIRRLRFPGARQRDQVHMARNVIQKSKADSAFPLRPFFFW